MTMKDKITKTHRKFESREQMSNEHILIIQMVFFLVFHFVCVCADTLVVITVIAVLVFNRYQPILIDKVNKQCATRQCTQN